MIKIYGLVAVSLASLALIGCDSRDDTNSEATTGQTDGTSEMTGGVNDLPNPNLGTANGQDVDEVDVQPTPGMQQTEEEMTGAEAIEDQTSELRRNSEQDRSSPNGNR